jgi:hypothetical protein
LHNVAPLQLVVAGRIVRARDQHVAIRTVQHEFRTMGTPSAQRSTSPIPMHPPAILTAPAVFASLGKML